MSIMAWYPLPQSGSAPSAGDEFFENQAAGWSLWSFSPADGHGAAKHGIGGGAARADQHTEGSLAPLVPQLCGQPTDDVFMSQLSDEEVKKMDAPFAALDMFPDSMHRLMSYENMLGGVLTGGSESEDQNGVDAMDTCGFPLFSHDLQSAGPSSPEILLVPVPDLTPIKDHQAGTTSMAKRSRSVVAGEESEHDLEALVLEELEDVVIQLTKRTRVCFRDAFFRMAESTRDKCGAAVTDGDGASGSGVGSSSIQAEGNTSRVSTPPGCPPERETNAIDRTVAFLTLTAPFVAPPPPEAHASRYAGGYSGPEAQSTTSWTAAA